MRDVLAPLKALSDENRLRLLMAVSENELCLCQLVELLSLATSTVSKHMSILQQAGLISARKEGKWTYFQVDFDSPAFHQHMTEMVTGTLQKDPTIRSDRKRMKEILKILPEELCRSQSACKTKDC